MENHDSIATVEKIVEEDPEITPAKPVSAPSDPQLMSTEKTVIISGGGAGADNGLRETQPATHIPDQPGFGDDLDSLAQMIEDG